MLKLKVSLAAILVSAAGTGLAHGAVITATGSGIYNTIPPAGNAGPGYAGYDFFAVNNGPDISNLPSFLTVDTTGDSRFSGSGYSFITITGVGLVQTGVAYDGPVVGGLNVLATITLNTGVPTSFQLGFLENSSNDAGNNTVLTLHSSEGGTDVLLNSPRPSVIHTINDFFFVNVSGGVPGDTITVSGARFNHATLGGITVDIPEPASLGIMGLGAVTLLRRRRRRA